MPTPPLGAPGTPATTAPPAASMQPDISTVLAAVNNLQTNVGCRFDGVERCLTNHGVALQDAVGAVAALQRTQSSQTHRERLEAFEASLDARPATASPAAAQADTGAELTSLAARLESLEERRTPPSHRTPSGPTTAADNSFGPPSRGAIADLFATNPAVLRAVASVPREEMHLAVEAIAARAGLPPALSRYAARSSYCSTPSTYLATRPPPPTAP